MRALEIDGRGSPWEFWFRIDTKISNQVDPECRRILAVDRRGSGVSSVSYVKVVGLRDIPRATAQRTKTRREKLLRQ